MVEGARGDRAGKAQAQIATAAMGGSETLKAAMRGRGDKRRVRRTAVAVALATLVLVVVAAAGGLGVGGGLAALLGMTSSVGSYRSDGSFGSHGSFGSFGNHEIHDDAVISIDNENSDESDLLTNWTDMRLPDRIRAQRYALDVAVAADGRFGGAVRMRLRVGRPTAILVVHARGLALSNVSVVRLPDHFNHNFDHNQDHNNPYDAYHGAVPIAVASVEMRDAEEYAVVFLRDPVANASLALSAAFAGNLSSGLEGFYRAAVPVDTKYPHAPPSFLATTQFEPTYARRAFPCLDQPDMKAVFDIAITAESPYFALSNMPLASLTTLENGDRKFSFLPTVPMSTYLVAFIVSDFESIEASTKNGIAVRVWTPKRKSHLGKFALDAAVIALDYYQDAFAIPYPLPKCDLIAIPDFSAGAMENWGLITFRDTALLIDPVVSSASMRQRVAIVVAHELAHQWFGNLVTMRWWNDLWLNEGFAEFIEYKGTAAIAPSWRMADQYLSSDLYRALNADESIFTHPIAVSVHNPADIANLFDDISYGKGSAVLRMLESYLTIKVDKDFFFSRLSWYLTNHKYSNAETHELWEALQPPNDPPGSLAAFMSTWTAQPGFPVVSVSFPTKASGVSTQSTSDSTFFEISQTRFLFSGLVDPLDGVNLSHIPPVLNVPSDPSSQSWVIPLVYTILSNETGKIERVGGNQFVEFSDKRATRVALPDTLYKHAVVLANVGKTGVYRIDYDTRTLQHLVEWLERDSTALKSIERAALLSDVFTMTFSGRLHDATIALRLSRILASEIDPIVWRTALVELGTMRKAFAHHPSYGLILQFHRRLVSKVVDSIGWFETSRDTNQHHLRALTRSTILQEAVRISHRETVHKALKYFDKLRDGQLIVMNIGVDVNTTGVAYDDLSDVDSDVKRAIPPDALQAVLMAGVMHSDDMDAAYDYVLSLYESSTLASDKQTYLYALASSPASYLQMRTLELVLPKRAGPPQVRLQDVTTLIENVASITPVGHLTVWNFLMSNWNDVVDLWRTTGGDFPHFNDLLEDAVGKFTNPYLISEARRLFVDRLGDRTFFLPPNSFTSILKGVETATQLLAWQTRVRDDVTAWLCRELDSPELV